MCSLIEENWRTSPSGPFDERQVITVERLSKGELEHQLVLDAIARAKPRLRRKAKAGTKKKVKRKMKSETVAELQATILAVAPADELQVGELLSGLSKMPGKALEQLQDLLKKVIPNG